MVSRGGRGAGQVCKQSVELTDSLCVIAAVDPLSELIGVKAAVGVMAAQTLGDSLAVCVAGARGGIRGGVTRPLCSLSFMVRSLSVRVAAL